jgi:tRNA A37 threonylcarbamoyltransferase TsaD
MLCIGICEISDVAIVAVIDVIDVIVDGAATATAAVIVVAATVAIALLFTVHQQIFHHLTHHTPYTTHRRLLELLEARAASADARLLSVRQKKHPLETDYNPVKTKAMKLIFPPPALCTDNGVMVAWAGIEKLQLGISDSIEGQVMTALYILIFFFLLFTVVLFLFFKP